MNTFKHQDLVDFVMSQPDYLPIRMDEVFNTSKSCGCVLVHFGVAKGILPLEHGVGMSDIDEVNSDNMEATHDFIESMLHLNETTYAKAKEVLKELQQTS